MTGLLTADAQHLRLIHGPRLGEVKGRGVMAAGTLDLAAFGQAVAGIGIGAGVAPGIGQLAALVPFLVFQAMLCVMQLEDVQLGGIQQRFGPGAALAVTISKLTLAKLLAAPLPALLTSAWQF